MKDIEYGDITLRMLEKLEKGQKSTMSVEEILKHDFGPELWTVDKLIPQDSITAITGAPASFKTWLTLDIARCVSKGLDFLGEYKASQGKVLIIDKENHLRHIQKRLNLLKFGNESIQYYVGNDDFLIDKEMDFIELSEIITKENIKLVIFDSFVRIHSGDENESKYVNKVMKSFRRLTNLGTTIIFIHHNRKENLNTQSTTNSIRGSSDILAGIDCLLQVTKLSKESLHITQSKLRLGEEVDPFSVQINRSENHIKFIYGGKSGYKNKETNEVRGLILILLKDKNEMSRQDIIKEFEDQYKPITVNASLKELEQSKEIIKKVVAHGEYLFSLNLKPESLDVETKSEHNPVDVPLLKIDDEINIWRKK